MLSMKFFGKRHPDFRKQCQNGLHKKINQHLLEQIQTQMELEVSIKVSANNIKKIMRIDIVPQLDVVTRMKFRYQSLDLIGKTFVLKFVEKATKIGHLQVLSLPNAWNKF